MGSFVKVTMAACSAFISHHFQQYFRAQALQEEAATKIHSGCHCGPVSAALCLSEDVCVNGENALAASVFLNKRVSHSCELTRCRHLCWRCSSSPKFPSGIHHVTVGGHRLSCIHLRCVYADTKVVFVD